jgi:hypothetical protein
LDPILSRSDDPVAALVRWRIGLLAHPTRAALADLARFPLGVAARELPGSRAWDGPVAELAAAAMLHVTDRGEQAWLRVPGTVRDGVGTNGCTG